MGGAVDFDVLPLGIKFELVPCGSKGMGVKALSKIKIGERIWEETPALIGKPAMADPDIDVDLEDVESQVLQLTKSEQKAFWALHDCAAHDGQKSVAGIWFTNSMEIGEACQGSSALYLIGSRFNHSCKANVIHKWMDSLGMHIFRAARDIQWGEELCISYSPNGTFAERQADFDHWKFSCQCQLCNTPLVLRRRSDKLRIESRELRRLIFQSRFSHPHEALILLRRAQEIVEQEFDGDAWMTQHLYELGFTIGLSLRDVDLAQSMMRKAVELGDTEPELSCFADDPLSCPLAMELGLVDAKLAVDRDAPMRKRKANQIESVALNMQSVMPTARKLDES